MVNPEIIKFIESTTKAMRELSSLVRTLHNKITDLEIKNNQINLELEHIQQAIKPRVIK